MRGLDQNTRSWRNIRIKTFQVEARPVRPYLLGGRRMWRKPEDQVEAKQNSYCLEHRAWRPAPLPRAAVARKRLPFSPLTAEPCTLR